MEITLGIIGVIIALITLHLTFFSEPKQHKETLLALFRATQKTSKDVSDRIFRLAETRNGWENEAMPGFTYRTYYHALLNSQKDNLSEELYNKVANMKLTKSGISIMQESLQAQFNALIQMQAALKVIESDTSTNSPS